jgi:hypothetical protein
MFTYHAKIIKLLEKVDRVGILSVDDLIMAGDLNLTTNLEEIWGETTQVDSLAGHFHRVIFKKQFGGCGPG